MDFFYFGLCHFCKKPNSDLKRCSNCKLLHYCSPEHQRNDWPKHEKICNAISRTNKILCPPPDATSEDLKHWKVSQAVLWRVELGRDLSLCENHMWMFPKICSVCFSREADIICNDCSSVAYCSDEHKNTHRESHEKYCSELKLSMIFYQNMYNPKDQPVDVVKMNIAKDVLKFPDTIQGVLEIMNYPKPMEYSDDHIRYITKAELFAPAINMVNALDKSGFIENRRLKKAKIVIHVVGPDIEEAQMFWPLIVEFLSHWIINLKTIEIFLVGPKVNQENISINLKCEECKAKNFSANVYGNASSYHDVVHDLPRPDLVAAFNSGINEYANCSSLDTWLDSIPCLVRFRRVPTILTAYTEPEIIADVKRFKESKVKFFMKPQRNPYSNLRPVRNWEEGSVCVSYQNMYVTIFAKK